MAILLFLTLAVLAHGMMQPVPYIRLTVLYGALYLSWVLPQLHTIMAGQALPARGLAEFVAMACLSLAAGWVGWYSAPLRAGPSAPGGSRTGDMIVPACVLTAVSVGINLRIGAMSLEMEGVSQWSGPITILAFFGMIRHVTFALSLLLFLRRPSAVFLLLFLLNLSTTLPLVMVGLRRTEIMGFLMTVLIGLWFARGIRVPVLALVLVAASFSVVVYVIGPLRTASSQIEEETGIRPSILSPALWARVDVEHEMRDNVGDAPDVKNAIHIMALRAETGGFGLGSQTWNRFVFQYFPGQIFGPEVKTALYLGNNRGKQGDNTGIYDEIESRYGYNYQLGTTQTGLGSAYNDFGLAGALYFFVIFHVMRRIFNRGMAGDIWSQALYIGLMALTITSLTHNHALVMTSFPLLAVTVWFGRRLQYVGLAPGWRRAPAA